MHQVLGVDSVPVTAFWLFNISIKENKEMLAHFVQAPSDIHTVKAQP